MQIPIKNPLSHPPGESPPPTNSQEFMIRFKEGSKIDTSLEDDDIRALQSNEDQIFKKFAWSDAVKVNQYKM